VTLSLVIRRDGSVADFSISKSSGFEALDTAVLRMLERAQPLPPFPASMREEEIPIDFPVSFSLSRL
jgi:protein TonB